MLSCTSAFNNKLTLLDQPGFSLQGDYVYVLLEDTNSGLVQAKFHEDGSVATAACVSDKTTVYAFQHKRKFISAALREKQQYGFRACPTQT